MTDTVKETVQGLNGPEEVEFFVTKDADGTIRKHRRNPEPNPREAFKYAVEDYKNGSGTLHQVLDTLVEMSGG